MNEIKNTKEKEQKTDTTQKLKFSIKGSSGNVAKFAFSCGFCLIY